MEPTPTIPTSNLLPMLRSVLEGVDGLMKQINALMSSVTLSQGPQMSTSQIRATLSQVRDQYRVVLASLAAVHRRVESSTGRLSSDLRFRVTSFREEGIPASHLVVYPRRVTRDTARHLPSLTQAALPPEISRSDEAATIDDPAQTLAELVRIRETLTRTTEEMVNAETVGSASARAQKPPARPAAPAAHPLLAFGV